MSQDPNRPPTPITPPPADAHDLADDPDYKAWSADPVNARHTKDIRNENARYRVRARTAETQLAALDPTGEGRISLQGAQAEIRSLKIENGLQAVAHSLGVGNVKLLRAYLHEAGSLKDLDPADASFLPDLENVVAEALEEEPALKTGRPGVSSSTAAPTTGARFTPSSPSVQLGRADLSRLSPQEIVDLKNRGALDALLGRQ